MLKMITGFKEIKDNFASFDNNQSVKKEEIDYFKNNSIIVLTAGGLGQRASEIKGFKNINKNAYVLPNGKSIIEMSIELFKKSGYTDFVALVFHKAESIIEQIGKGEEYGVNIKYSYDPDIPVGRGGAILNALVNGTIPRDKSIIVYNPIDVIAGYKGDFVDDLISGHLANSKKGAIATAIVTEGFEAPFSCLRLDNSIVTDWEFHPMIPIPSHMGISILTPDVYPYLDENIDLSKKCDFEKLIFPMLAKEKKLAAVKIPQECWYPVKDLKTLERLEKYLKANN
jgi:NDP-sugar pyrophosphorylase family protein